MDPADCIKLCIKWNDQYFTDKAISFGWPHCYINDYIATLPCDRAQNAFDQLCNLFEDIELPMNTDNLTPHSKCLTCLGIEVDIDKNGVRIQPDKLQEIYAECLKVKSLKNQSFSISVRQTHIYIYKMCYSSKDLLY